MQAINTALGGGDLRNLHGPATSADQLAARALGGFGVDAATVVVPVKGASLVRGGGRTAAAEGSRVGKTVLGHYPEYKQLADTIGARRFNIPEAAWNKMSGAEQWAANQKFLDRMVVRGDDIVLATPLDKVRPGSYFARELEYLAAKGYRPSADGTKLIGQ